MECYSFASRVLNVWKAKQLTEKKLYKLLGNMFVSGENKWNICKLWRPVSESCMVVVPWESSPCSRTQLCPERFAWRGRGGWKDISLYNAGSCLLPSWNTVYASGWGWSLGFGCNTLWLTLNVSVPEGRIWSGLYSTQTGIWDNEKSSW